MRPVSRVGGGKQFQVLSVETLKQWRRADRDSRNGLAGSLASVTYSLEWIHGGPEGVGTVERNDLVYMLVTV